MTQLSPERLLIASPFPQRVSGAYLAAELATVAQRCIHGHVAILDHESRTAKLLDADAAVNAGIEVKLNGWMPWRLEIDAGRLEDDGTHARLVDGIAYRLHGSLEVERIDDCALDIECLENARDAERGHVLAHHRAASARVWLLAGHGRRRVVEYAHDHIVLVVDGVNDARDAAGKEGRIAHEAKRKRARVSRLDALRDGDATTHAQAGVDHVERCGIAERVAPDVTAEDGLAFAHGAFDGIEARAMRATRA